MKEAGTAHWLSPNGGATNESGFTGLPAGGRSSYQMTGFTGLGNWGSWWSATSTESGGKYAVFFTTESASSVGYASDDWQALKSNGFSVRCLKDN